ncbi:MAG: tetratricopeptide repeat protein [Phycisphaeraceae bacterium]
MSNISPHPRSRPSPPGAHLLNHPSRHPARARTTKPLTLLLLLTLTLLTACSESAPNQPTASPLSPEEAAIAIATQESRLLDANNTGTISAQLQQDILNLAKQLPDNATAQSLVARLQLAIGQTQQAYASALHALSLDPDQPELRLLTATIAVGLNHNDQAIPHLDHVIAQRPNDIKALLLLGTAQLRRNQLDAAQTAFTRAAQLDPTANRAHAGLSGVAEKRGDIPAALRHLRQAIDLTDDLADPDAWRNITIRKARLLRALGRPADAAAELRNLPPNDLATLDASREYAQCLTDAGDPSAAASHFEQLALILPEDVTLAAEAARWRFRAGDTPRANDWLQRARSINPTHPLITEVAAELLTPLSPAPP